MPKPTDRDQTVKNDHPRNYNQLLQAVKDYANDRNRSAEDAREDLEMLRDELDLLIDSLGS